MKTILIIIGLVIILAGTAMGLPPSGFVNYDTWERLPCLDVVLFGHKFHVHGYDRDGDKAADAAELFQAPNYKDQPPTLYTFDVDENGEFGIGETFTEKEVMKEE